MPTSVPLVRVHRGPLVESVHCGSYVLFEAEDVLAAAGDPDHVAFFRSTAKPFQAMAALTSGAAERFDLTPEELAIGAGSHNASPHHLAIVRRILAKSAIPEDALRCGGHWSIDPALARRQARTAGPEADPLPRLWSNCSGKHALMLAAAKALGAPLDTYLAPDYPVQREITAALAAFTGVAAEDIVLGTDGCGAPVHGVSIRAMARAMGRLAHPGDLPAPYATCAQRIGAAMSAHPVLIAGEGRFDTDLMQSAATRILSKGGAEGIHGVGVPERRLGLAVHIDDGNDRGYRQVVIDLLARHDVLTAAEAAGLRERHGRTIRNWMGTVVGRLEVVV